MSLFWNILFNFLLYNINISIKMTFFLLSVLNIEYFFYSFRILDVFAITKIKYLAFNIKYIFVYAFSQSYLRLVFFSIRLWVIGLSLIIYWRKEGWILKIILWSLELRLKTTSKNIFLRKLFFILDSTLLLLLYFRKIRSCSYCIFESFENFICFFFTSWLVILLLN